MFKWVIGLCAAIYVTLLVVGAPPEDGDVLAASPEAGQDMSLANTPAEQPVQVSIDATSEPPQPVQEVEIVVVAPVVAPSEALTPPVIESASLSGNAQEAVDQVVMQVTTSSAPIQSLSADGLSSPAPETVQPTESVGSVDSGPVETDGVGEIWTVTGSRVNLRLGPGTATSVVGQATRGDSAEVIELMGNGWARVYILDLGIEAYMSVDFISRES